MTREQFIILFENHVDPAKWYTYEKEVWQVWQEMSHHFQYEHSCSSGGLDGLYCELEYDVFTEHVTEDENDPYDQYDPDKVS